MRLIVSDPIAPGALFQPEHQPTSLRRVADASHRRHVAESLRERSTPYFRDVLAQLIRVASHVQRLGGQVDLRLRRGVAASPHVSLWMRIRDRDIEFLSRVDLDGIARAYLREQSRAGRIPLVQDWDLGDFKDTLACAIHQQVLDEVVATLGLPPTDAGGRRPAT